VFNLEQANFKETSWPVPFGRWEQPYGVSAKMCGDIIICRRGRRLIPDIGTGRSLRLSSTTCLQVPTSIREAAKADLYRQDVKNVATAGPTACIWMMRSLHIQITAGRITR